MSARKTGSGLVDLNSLALPELYDELSRGRLVRRLLEIARDEDLGDGGVPGDVTTRACAGRDRGHVTARVAAREACVVAGLAATNELADVFGAEVTITPECEDGTRAEAGETVAVLEGAWYDVLTLERALLNLLTRLSGVATLTAAYAERIREAGGAARLLDTRKTTPGLRVLEKYAVRCGGGWCHRIGLHDAVLIKDNHIAHVSARDLGAFVRTASERARREGPIRFVEVEVDRLAQLDSILALERGVVDVVLLDNMDAATLGEAVARRDARGSGVLLEASGGVTLETIGDVSRTGVDRISVGALTHGAVGVDLGLDFA